MSYKAQPKLRESAYMFYPNVIPVDKIYNPITKKDHPHTIKTGPFRKDLCTNDDGDVDVNGYFRHLKFKYDDRKSRIANKEKVNPNEVL